MAARLLSIAMINTRFVYGILVSEPASEALLGLRRPRRFRSISQSSFESSWSISESYWSSRLIVITGSLRAHPK